MIKQQPRKHSVEGLAVLLLFGVFASCILSVLLMGADVCQKVAARDQASYDRRTAAQYLATRVRQADCGGGIVLDRFDGQDALVLPQTLDGVEYYTYVYCYDGYLRELFAAADAPMTAADGEKVLPAAALALEAEGSCLTARLQASDGFWQQVTLDLRSGEGAAA